MVLRLLETERWSSLEHASAADIAAELGLPRAEAESALRLLETARQIERRGGIGLARIERGSAW